VPAVATDLLQTFVIRRIVRSRKHDQNHEGARNDCLQQRVTTSTDASINVEVRKPWSYGVRSVAVDDMIITHSSRHTLRAIEPLGDAMLRARVLQIT
jgi:hypothetical protein